MKISAFLNDIVSKHVNIGKIIKNKTYSFLGLNFKNLIFKLHLINDKLIKKNKKIKNKLIKKKQNFI